jgi:hypothetical protein
MVDEFTIARALYGDLIVVLGAAAEGYPHDVRRKQNGYFMRTTRVSAVVIQETSIVGGCRADQARSVSHEQSERPSADARRSIGI